MKPFDSVVIGSARDTFAEAQAMRAALESFLLDVHLYWFRQKRNLTDFLAGNVADSEYVVLCCHGSPGEDESDPARVTVHNLVEEIDGKWESGSVDLRPDDIRREVRFPGRTVITQGCGTGVPETAEAFLDAGCRAYIGTAGYADQDAGPMFVIGFFYHLLRNATDPRVNHSDEDAARLAASIDTASKEGTHLFRYYSRA